MACPFCEIVVQRDPAVLVLETETSVTFSPLEPATRGHLLVVPRSHVADFLQAAPCLAGALFADVSRVAVAVNEVIRPDGLNVLTSVGEAATQTVMHLHVHVLPRWHDDRVWSFWPATPDSAVELAADGWADAVRQALSS